jgi:hypothetical protein
VARICWIRSPLITWFFYSAFFNNITYVGPKVPTLYTALNAGELATNPAVYGDYTHPFVLEKDQIVQVVVNNLDTGKHPFHLHGHGFQALYRSADDAGTFQDSNITEADFPAIPMRRDTLVLHPSGFMVYRFKANNPGMASCQVCRNKSGLTVAFRRCMVLPLSYRMACYFWAGHDLRRSASRAAKELDDPAGSPWCLRSCRHSYKWECCRQQS